MTTKDNYIPSGTKERLPPNNRLPIRQKVTDWSDIEKQAEELGAPRFSPTTEPHLTKPDPKEAAVALANQLGRKPFSQWTDQEMQEAMRVLGPEGVSIIREYQEEKRRGY